MASKLEEQQLKMAFSLDTANALTNVIESMTFNMANM
jgi:hypothetical protein